ncbi:hypothetical protein [Corynebacterium hindlerae]|nr:hypothetical protein [Corynebacterium hindlerae]
MIPLSLDLLSYSFYPHWILDTVDFFVDLAYDFVDFVDAVLS